MVKGLCITGMAFGALLVVIFGIDLAIGMPFGRPSAKMNIVFIVAGILLALMGWSLQREQT
ncbi:MAG: hypothetical protein K8T25_13840 [Planctomycetia bacterium]|nr:hypothetical protein [Planctomycetia bacterium]